MTTRELLSLMALAGAISLLLFLAFSKLAHCEEIRGSDEQVRRVIQRGLDEAFQNQVEHLFSNWMKDETGQPGRAAAGVRKAVRAYRHAMVAIDNEKLGLVPLPRPREASR